MMEHSNIHPFECGFQQYLRMNIAILSMFSNLMRFMVMFKNENVSI